MLQNMINEKIHIILQNLDILKLCSMTMFLFLETLIRFVLTLWTFLEKPFQNLDFTKNLLVKLPLDVFDTLFDTDLRYACYSVCGFTKLDLMKEIFFIFKSYNINMIFFVYNSHLYLEWEKPMVYGTNIALTVSYFLCA